MHTGPPSPLTTSNITFNFAKRAKQVSVPLAPNAGAGPSAPALDVMTVEGAEEEDASIVALPKAGGAESEWETGSPYWKCEYCDVLFPTSRPKRVDRHLRLMHTRELAMALRRQAMGKV